MNSKSRTFRESLNNESPTSRMLVVLLLINLVLSGFNFLQMGELNARQVQTSSNISSELKSLKLTCSGTTNLSGYGTPGYTNLDCATNYTLFP